jgi:hypothetical protein
MRTLAVSLRNPVVPVVSDFARSCPTRAPKFGAKTEARPKEKGTFLLATPPRNQLDPVSNSATGTRSLVARILDARKNCKIYPTYGLK